MAATVLSNRPSISAPPTSDSRSSSARVAGCCACIRGRPSLNSRRYYPDNYWFAPQENSVSRLEELYRRFVLRDHVNFVSSAFRTEDGPIARCRMRRSPVRTVDGRPRLSSVRIGFLEAGGARSRGHRMACRLWQETFPSAPFPNDFFAAITMFHVLEHLYDPGCLSPGRVASAEARGTADRPGSRTRRPGSFCFSASTGMAWMFRGI